MTERYFSPAEVEALIPALTSIMDDVRRAHGEARVLGETMQDQQRQIALAGGSVVDREQWRTMRERLERLGQQVREGLNRVVSLGGAPKDVDLGLVDFLHLREGRVVHLCWKHGEREIRFWHGLDEGYAGRKSL
ncbi:MAG TPA: DUF2203 domain-containing protein [Methylomirabilota bacterium]|jgi:hypothetical protein